jgi:diguanylate cyclase (GGDEF)-like protein/putative nucleotidyltransferase with HDIG domain
MPMEKILCCVDKSLKKKFSFPCPYRKTSSLKEAYKKDFPIIIFHYQFLKRRKRLDTSKLWDKVCFVYFSNQSEENIKIVQHFKLFGYFTAGESKSHILFKLKHAREIVNYKRKINNLEKEISKKDKRIEEIILVDPLTGCYNWRYFLSRSHQELSRARRHLYNISFAVIDIDYFRHINELYGSRIADRVIKDFTLLLRKNLRKEDVLTRWREDEFFIIFPYLSKGDAYKVARRIKDKLSSHKFRYGGGLSISVKASLGIVSFPEDKIFNTRDIIGKLDGCVMEAKKRGGDVVLFYSQQKTDIASCEEKKEANIQELRQKIEKLNSLLTRDLLEMIYGFARAIEAKDQYTGKHVEYTASIAEKISEELQLSRSEIENIKRAAILHDLGKVGIDENILSKKGPLTKEERKAIESHPGIAAEILREIHALRRAVPAILYHHERYDGKGYPLRLKGEEIPLSARIVAIADVYQALISDRPYRKAYSKREAIEIVRQESGKHFDPKIVKIFLKVIRKIR